MPEVVHRDWKQIVRQHIAGTSLQPARESEIVEEVSQHLADRHDELLTSGLPDGVAYSQVVRELGAHDLIQGLKSVERTAIEQPAFGAEPLGGIFSGIGNDFRYAIRLLKTNPTFTAVAVLSLALGIGANTGIFQLLNAVRLRTLPVERPQELALVKLDNHGRGRTGEVTNGRVSQNTYAQFEQIRDHQQAFSGIAAWGLDNWDLNMGGEIQLARGLYVSGDYFNVLGVHAALGRLVGPADDVRGCGPEGVVISHGFWRERYAQDPNVLGRKITLDGHPYSIMGVTQEGFFGTEVGRKFDVALPMCAEAIMRPEHSALSQLDYWWLVVIGRLKPGWTVEKASAQLAAISPTVFQNTLPPTYRPSTKQNYLADTLTAVSGATGASGLRTTYSDPLYLLLAITGLVLLIACANLANLMLARASAREREIAIRLALGAARARIIRQLLTEAFLISMLGAALGLFIAYNLSHVLISFLSTNERPIFVDIGLDWRMFLFTGAVAILTCLLFGLAPAIKATSAMPTQALNAAAKSVTSSRERNGLRRTLVVVQVALSLVLVVSAMLFVRSLNHLLQADAGFRRDGIMVANFDLSKIKIPPDQRQPYKDRMLEAVRALPGIESAAQTNIVPITGAGWNEGILVNNQRVGESNAMRVSPGMFSTIETPLLAGRDFDQRDTATSPKVAIVNRAFAEQLFKNPNPIGLTFTIKSYETKVETYQVIGLAKNTKYEDMRNDFEPMYYVPASQDNEPDLFPSFMVRSDLPPDTVAAELKEAVAKINPSISLEMRIFSRQIIDSLARERMLAFLSGFLGLLAGVLAVVGLYGVISYMVVRRTNEIGIRMALGATRRDIVRMILREAGALLGIGLAIGTLLALVAGRTAASLLYGLKPTDIATFVMAISSLTMVTIAATLVPAQRASRLDPMNALRTE